MNTDGRRVAKEERAKVVDKVRKLLANAGNNPSAEEAATAAGMAEALLAKYNISFADVQIEELDAGEGLKTEKVYANVNVGAAKKISSWAQWLAVACADYYDCHCRTTDGRVRVSANQEVTARMVEFVGYELDVQVCAWMYGYLFRSVCNSSMVFAQTLNRDGILGNAMKRPLMEFREGASLAIAGRLRMMIEERNQKRAADDRGTALVLHKRYKVEELFGEFKYKDTDKTPDVDSGAFASGVEAGKRVDLNVRGVGEQGRPAKIAHN